MRFRSHPLYRGGGRNLTGEYPKTNKTKTISVAPYHDREVMILWYWWGKRHNPLKFWVQMAEKHHNPNCVSDSYFLTLPSCVFCAFLSAAARPQGFTRSQGTKRETLGGRVGGPACLSTGCGVRQQEGWWRVVVLINLPELVCESLRDSDSQAAVRGHLRPGCTEELLSGFSTAANTSCYCPSTKNCNEDPRFRRQCPVISTYVRYMAALPSVKPGVRSAGALMKPKHHRHLAEMKGGAAHFSLALLPAISALKCAIITLKGLCTYTDRRPFLLM